jgi:hypothetical protein
MLTLCGIDIVGIGGQLADGSTEINGPQIELAGLVDVRIERDVDGRGGLPLER